MSIMTVETSRITGQCCPLCGQGGTRYVGVPQDGLRLCDCADGGVLLSWPFSSVDEYERQYGTGEYHEEEMLRSGRPAFVARDTEYLETAAHRLNLLKAVYPNANTLLDIGAGTGALVAQAQATGWNALGLEPSRTLTAWARSQGRSITCARWDWVLGLDGPLPPVVTLYDVLEHLTEPERCLRAIAARLTGDGIVVIEMPEFRAPGNWERHIKPREHLCLYSQNAAERLFATCGLRIDLMYRPCGAKLGKIAWFLRGEN